MPPPRCEIDQVLGFISISLHDSSFVLSGLSSIWSMSQNGRGPRCTRLIALPWPLPWPGLWGAARAGMASAMHIAIFKLIVAVEEGRWEVLGPKTWELSRMAWMLNTYSIASSWKELDRGTGMQQGTQSVLDERPVGT